MLGPGGDRPAVKVAVVYVDPMVELRRYHPLALRFIQSYQQFPPGQTAHTLHVYFNGSSPTEFSKAPFAGVDHVAHTYSNVGWDIGAFQQAAEQIDCDMLVCLGAPVHFYRAGWLDRMVDAFIDNSPALFGCWGIPYRDIWHIRTTAFWFQPELLRHYPNIIPSTWKARHDFEYGRNSITLFAEQMGFDPLMVTWDGIYEKPMWKYAWDTDSGDGHCLLFDQHTHR